jgi:hypothetical protein
MAFPERRRRHCTSAYLPPSDQAGEAAAPPGRPHEQHQDPGGGVPLDEGREGGQRQALQGNCLWSTNPAACASCSAETSMSAPQTPMTQCTLNAMIATMRSRNCVPPFSLFPAPLGRVAVLHPHLQEMLLGVQMEQVQVVRRHLGLLTEKVDRTFENESLSWSHIVERGRQEVPVHISALHFVLRVLICPRVGQHRRHMCRQRFVFHARQEALHPPPITPSHMLIICSTHATLRLCCSNIRASEGPHARKVRGDICRKSRRLQTAQNSGVLRRARAMATHRSRRRLFSRQQVQRIRRRRTTEAV